MDTAASKALMKWLAKNVRGAKHIYVVGGAVRNFKIDRPVKDIDMVVDSLSLGKDAAWVAGHIANKIPAMTRVEGPDNLRVTKVHIKGPWVVEGHDLNGETLDIVDARKEVYERDPETGEYVGHKPLEVVPTTLEEDVTRREFTFNTLMWRLSELAEGPDKAEIIDLTGCGIRDLENRDMRCPTDADEVFAIDPTRVIRIIKFAFKYGFKLPPDVKAAAKRQAKGLKRIPDKTFSVIRDIALESPHYKKALNVMADLGVTEVLAEMMEDNKSFRAAMTNFAEKKGIAYLFDLMDKGIPVGASMKFLSGGQQQRLREITAPMDRDEALEFLSVLKNPGRAYDKKFIPSLAMSHGYKGKEMAKFMPGVIAIGREVLLEDPDLASNPGKLMKQVKERVDRSKSASRLAKTFTINKGQPVWYGKYKNQRGIVKDFGVSDKGDPTITLEQLPAPSSNKPSRKSPKTMSLFKIRPRVEDEHDNPTEKSASVPKKYEHIDFKPPQGVADAAAKGLELRQKASPSNRGGLTTEEASKEGIGSGVQRAVNLKNRNNVTPKVIKQMRGFLSRSEKSSEISEDNKGTPWNDKGYVAWLLWGGDPAKAWVNKIIKQMEAADEKDKQSKQAAIVSRRYTIKRAFQGDRVFRSPKPFRGFRNVSQTSKITTWNKPQGLWYSCGNDWEDWCSDNAQGGSFGKAHLEGTPYRYNIDIDRSRMAFIHSKQDFYDFVRYFGVGEDNQYINWAAVAKEFDGIEICPYFQEFRYEFSWYQGWDVAGGCVWGSGAVKSIFPAEVYCSIKTASDNEPTNPKLWEKVQALAKGEQASMTHGGKTINGPNDGRGFTVFPSAYANGWASKTYKDLGGGWKKKGAASEDCDAMVSTAWVSPQGKMVFLRGQSHEDFAEKWALRNEPELHSRITEYAQTARPHASIWHRVLLDRGWLQLQGMSSIVVPPRPSRKQLQNVADFFANCIADGTSNPDRITLHIMGLDPALRGKVIQPGEDRYPFDVQERVSLADFIEREASGPVIEDMYESMMERPRRASLTEAWGPTLREAKPECSPFTHSYAWVNPDGRLFKVSDHRDWANKYTNKLYETHDWEREEWDYEGARQDASPELKRLLEWGGSGSIGWLISEGWVKIVNAYAFSSLPWKDLTQKARKQVLETVVRCAVENRVDPENQSMIIEQHSPDSMYKLYEDSMLDAAYWRRWNSSREHLPGADKVYEPSVAEFVSRWGGRRYEEALFEGLFSKIARGKAKKDVGHGGLDEWFSGHGGAKGKGEDATWGDWVSISPVTKTLPSGKKVEKGDIVGECGISDDPDWKDITKGGEDPLKCMPRQKAHDMPKKERAEKAEAKQKAEKADSSRGKKPTNTPTFDKKKASSITRLFRSPKLFGGFRSVSGQKVGFKPNGLWYSCGSAWDDWCRYEMPERAKAPFLYQLEVNLPRIITIRNESDFKDFESKYKVPHVTGMGVIDWKAVARDYDGIEVCPYQKQRRMSSDWYYPWDVASGCIWGPGAFKSAELVEVCGVRKQTEKESRFQRIQMKREAAAKLRSSRRGESD